MLSPFSFLRYLCATKLINQLVILVPYPWAGEYRQVNVSKGGFVFAMAAQVPRLMQEFERDVLAPLYALCF